MSWPVEKILEEAMKLDPKDRALVVAELEAAWRDEIARRAQGIQNGTADTVDGRELSQRVRAEYKP